MSTQVPPQQVCVPVHAAPVPHLHTPPLHTLALVVSQRLPQAPQLSMAVAVSTHAALALVAQHLLPVEHAAEAPHEHFPATQLLAVTGSHAPQVPPQRAVSVDGVVAMQAPATPLVQVLLPKPHAAPPVRGPEQSTCVPSTQAPTAIENVTVATEPAAVALRESCTLTMKLVAAVT